MVARRLRWMMVMELAFYVAIGYGLLVDGGSIAQALALALGCFLGIRALIVLTSYGFTFVYRRANNEKLTLVAVLGWLRMMLDEYLALILLYSLIMPFQERVLGPDRLRQSTERPPLLLIHGYQCNRGFWFWLRPRLEAAGWVVATHNLEPIFADIDSYADGVAQRVDAVLEATGARQLILVCHSMGGLAARAYLRKHGAAKLERVITLGTPHHGTRIAVLAPGHNGAQMRVGDPWLRGLAEGALPAGSVSIYSVNDNTVMPQQASSSLEGAKNVAISGVGHLGMATSSQVLVALEEALSAVGKNSKSA
jgi:triacylglycerol lipase